MTFSVQAVYIFLPCIVVLVARYCCNVDGKHYPARLVTLPCNLETLKTADGATYYKGGDVGQMMIVYEVRDPSLAVAGFIMQAQQAVLARRPCAALQFITIRLTLSTLCRCTAPCAVLSKPPKP